MSLGINLAERGYVPDIIARVGIRRLLKQRLRQDTLRTTSDGKSELITEMRQGPLAINTGDANQQHYEVPTKLFEIMLGSRMKYSSAFFQDRDESLDKAEETMLALSCSRAELEDGQNILELGCGWGSLTLYLAEHYPASQITAVSNSATQRIYIETQAARRNLDNISVVTADMNDFSTTVRFDRVMSIEMFEHMRNYQILFQKIANWLKQDGKLFFHIFCHRNMPYFFEAESADDWMAKHFFTGGMMPSFDLPAHFNEELNQEKAWEVNGLHYANTCAAWLKNLDHHKADAIQAITNSDNPDSAVVQFNRWRLFVMACQELFKYEQGTQWHVAHFLFAKAAGTQLRV
jgi:cyclopropane-fatty-acyl-phospholipid synthase